MASLKIKRMHARLACSAGILALAAGSAFAQSSNFSIPAEPLSDSLKAVARQSGQNILYTSGAIAGIRAPALHGQMSSLDAVKELLKGTGLQATPDGDDGLIVRLAGKARRSENLQPASFELASISDRSERPLVMSGTAPDLVLAQNTPAPQSTPAPEPAATGVEQVVVSASRITIAGYQQPTPVTVVGGAQIQEAANPDIGDTVRDLPAVGISSSPLKGGGGNSVFNPVAGLSTVNLRDLGIVRTLVLFDGQRVVASNVSGGVDLGTIPTALVSRIDVVTGGASAAWGSDAVAGVVNLVLNKNFTGFKSDIQASDTGQDNRRAYGAEASYGFDFDGNRGHIILSGAYHNSPDSVFVGSAKWWHSTYLLQNPAYTPTNGAVQYLHYSNVGQRATQGGVILSGPLANIQFVGSNGTPAPYDPGVFTGTLAAGGSSNPWNSEIPTDPLSLPYRTTTLFGYGSYMLTPEIKASVQLNYGHQYSMNNSTTALTQTLVIHNDNAYLPQSIKDQMAAASVTTFQFATPMTNNVDMHNPSYAAFQNSIGIPVNVVNRQLVRGVFSLDGALGDNWSWNAYYQHGETRIRSTPTHTVITANLTLASDAVYVTAANVGTSGLPIGSIACRSSLTNPTNGCQPLDVFGEGVASPNAVNYVNTDKNFETMVLNEDVFSGSMQGILPWNLTGAGAPSVAFGGEYRKEGGVNHISALAQAKALSVGNFGGLQGHYSVEEGFLETDVPLLKDNIVQNLDFNAAGRITSYSTSGMVETWKLGLTSQINDDVRLRTTWSYDIRAPDLAELFNRGSGQPGDADRSAQQSVDRGVHQHKRQSGPETGTGTDCLGRRGADPALDRRAADLGRLVLDQRQRLYFLAQRAFGNAALSGRRSVLLQPVRL